MRVGLQKSIYENYGFWPRDLAQKHIPGSVLRGDNGLVLSHVITLLIKKEIDN